MHSDLRRLVRSDDREKGLDREASGSLPRISGRLANESHSVLTLPVSGFRSKVEANDAASGHRPTRWVVDNNHGRCDQQAGRVDHVAKPVQTTLHGEELPGLHLGSCGK